ncbi:hypothetical protein G9A89_018882 [Geosiphon pyriformis]|nr:hypothetical protein G9A89_018882 [Geosiphon pyriformis]
MHLRSILPVFAPALVMAPLIDRLTANFVWLLEPLVQAVRNNQQPQKSRFEPHFNQPQQLSYQRQQNYGPPVTINNNVLNQRPNYANINFFGKIPLVEATSKSASQPKENSFYAFNLTDDDHDIDELIINTFKSTKKKKKAKIDFIIDPKKVFTSTANNNKPPKDKVFKNSPKLKPPEIVQKSGPYFVVKDLIKTSVYITFDQLITHLQFRKDLHKFLIHKKKTPKTNKHSRQARLADNSNVTLFIYKAQVAGYFINLILDNRSFVSIIVKHFLEAIGRKIDELFTRLMTNIHCNKKKSLDIAKAVSVQINDISIKTDIEISEAKKYTIIVGNE